MSAERVGYNYLSGDDQPGLERTARIWVKPSSELTERILQFVKPNIRDNLGRRGLFLTSNATQKVHHKLTGGELVTPDALMFSEFRKVEMAQRSSSSQGDGHMGLRRLTVVQEREPRGPKPAMLIIGLIPELGERAARMMMEGSYIASSNFILHERRGLPVHIGLPENIAVSSDARAEAENDLVHFVLGFPMTKRGINELPGVSPNRQAYVTDMKLQLDKLPTPRRAVPSEVE